MPPNRPTVDEGLGQRDRILELALQLMSEHGVAGMSMRRLADRCGLNVATLYHYFPSKADLLTQVIAHRSYADLLTAPPPVDWSLPAQERLTALLQWIWRSMGTQDDMWRLLLGESLRNDPQVIASAADLSVTFERALDDWLTTHFADLPGEARTTARVLRGVIYGFWIEHLMLPPRDRDRLLARRAEEVAAVVVPT